MIQIENSEYIDYLELQAGFEAGQAAKRLLNFLKIPKEDMETREESISIISGIVSSIEKKLERIRQMQDQQISWGSFVEGQEASERL